MSAGAVPVMLAILIAAGVTVTLLVVWSMGGGRRLTALLVGSYALKVAVAVSLYVISAWHLPILPSLHLADGFWTISRDAQSYHWLGIEIADALHWGIELPDLRFFGQPDSFIVVAWLYSAIGAHPLYVPLINAALWSGILYLAYWFGSRLNGPLAGRAAVVLLAVWPSVYIWSAQVMKDVLLLFLTLLLLMALTLVLDGRSRYLRTALLLVMLVPMGFVITRLRYYVVPLTLVSVAIVFVRHMIVPMGRVRATTMSLAALAAVVLLGVFVLAAGTDPSVLLSPARPQDGHLKKAAFLEAAGDREGAAFEYQRAAGQLPPPLPTATGTRLESPTLPLREAKRAALEHEAGGTATLPSQSSATAPPGHEEGGISLQRGVRELIAIVSPDRISRIQADFRTTFGGGELHPNSATAIRDVESRWDLVTQVPIGIAYALWAPFPWQWFATGETGVFRQIAAGEAILLMLLTPWLYLGAVRGLRSGRDDAWLLIAFAVTALSLMGVVVTNLGILFRLRLQFLMPLLIITAAYAGYRWNWVIRLSGPSRADT